MLKWYNMAVIACINIKSCHSTLAKILSLTPTTFFSCDYKRYCGRRGATNKINFNTNTTAPAATNTTFSLPKKYYINMWRKARANIKTRTPNNIFVASIFKFSYYKIFAFRSILKKNLSQFGFATLKDDDLKKLREKTHHTAFFLFQSVPVIF